MAWKQVLEALALNTRRSKDKLLQALPETVKTVDLRIDVHQNSKDPNKAVAKIQANSQAKDPAVKDFIKSGNKGGGHKGTHKNIAEIPFDRSTFDMDDFEQKIRNSRR
jgi:hypothetical protein